MARMGHAVRSHMTTLNGTSLLDHTDYQETVPNQIKLPAIDLFHKLLKNTSRPYYLTPMDLRIAASR